MPLLLWIWMFLLSAFAVDLPPELQPWVPWVSASHPDRVCPLVAGKAACVWPGLLTVEADDQGARWLLEVEVDRALAVALPGGPGAWPQQLQVDGRPAPVLERAEHPSVKLSPGAHRVQAVLRWSARPQLLSLPHDIGRVALVVDGVRVPWPQRDAEGLRLGATEQARPEGERLDLEVSRRVGDGVPVVVRTQVVVRASGVGREVTLGQVLVPGTRPTALQANLPARFDADGNLVVQVRAGTWKIRFDAVHEGEVSELVAPKPGPPWPAEETWAVATDDRVRAVNLSGPTGVDPARTSLPEAWRDLPAFSVRADTPLQIEQLRRGEPEPPPNQLQLVRELWLDSDGGGFTVRDRFSGNLSQGWRLDVLAPIELGHVSVGGVDQVITQAGGSQGVELREAALQLVAESRIEGRPLSLPAVGWDADVVSLSSTLHLPPGWSLLAGSGVDSLSGSVLASWSLFDLFFVLIVAMAVARLEGAVWGLVALAALVLGRHQPGAPQWLWVALVVVAALQRGLPKGWPLRLAHWSRLALLLLLTLVLVPFVVGQLRTGLFPAQAQAFKAPGVAQVQMEAPDRFVALDIGSSAKASAGTKDVRTKKAYLSKQVDKNAVIQTGPGVPSWSWQRQVLSWSGPVSRDHRMRLVLLGPGANLLLALCRVGLLLLLALRFARGLRLPVARLGATAVVASLSLSLSAQAAPSAALLSELEARLSAPPDCGSHCLTVPTASLSVRQDVLTVRAEVHAGVATAWPVPGPTSTWLPSEVLIDGRPAALRRQADGFLVARVSPGVHQLLARGPLPPSDALALQLGEPPKRLEWSGQGWALEGRKADGSVSGSVQLARVIGGGQRSEAQSSENLVPWLEVHRELDLGLPWRVRTVLKRVGPADHPLSVQVGLLAGEAVTDGAFEVVDGRVHASLERDVSEVSWVSSLEQAEGLTLTAPSGVPWTEVWTLSCSPVFQCAAQGPAPLRHVVEGRWSPVWRPWPGESVVLSVSRPQGVQGQTVTIDQARLDITPGQRQLVASLVLRVRSSQGGRQLITLPPGAKLQQVQIDGKARPLQLRDDGRLPVPLKPGSQELRVRWQQAHPPQALEWVPAVDLGGPAVNTTITVNMPQNRWIVALWGPRWGPTPLFWTFVLVVLIAAPLLGRLPYTPLATWQWALLGLGMTQVPAVAPLTVALWLVALGWRRQAPLKHWLAFDLLQLLLLGWTLVAMGCLYAAIHSGLLWQPDMQVAGAGSGDRVLHWFVDRSPGPLAQPLVVSLPLWVWRVGMLLWSLWLAGSLVRWLPWAWRAFSSEGLFRAPTVTVDDPMAR